MVWSDTFFTSNRRQYCNEADEYAAKKLANIPKDISLVYWNYYKNDYESYDKALKNHIKTDNKVIFAGGAWKWSGFTPWNEISIKRTTVAFNACKDNGIKDMFITAWGDDGCEASVFCTLPAQAVFAELCYMDNKDSAKEIFTAVTGADFYDFMALDMQVFDKNLKDRLGITTLYKTILYNDPLVGTMDMFFEQFDFTDNLHKVVETLTALENKSNRYTYLFRTAKALAEISVKKWDLSLRTKRLYDKKDIKGLKFIADREIPLIVERVEKFYLVWREQWEKENSTCGFEVHDTRIGGVVLRLKNAARLIDKYCNGEIEKIYDLEEQRLHLEKSQAETYGMIGTHKCIHTVNVS